MQKAVATIFMNMFIYAPILYQKRYTYWQDPGLQKGLHSCILLQQGSEAEIQTDCYWWKKKKNHFIQYNVLKTIYRLFFSLLYLSCTFGKKESCAVHVGRH